MLVVKNVAASSHPGQVRALNEDSHRIWSFEVANADDLFLMAVADGMGGAAAGEIASHIAIDALDESIRAYVKALKRGQKLVGVNALAEKVMRLANQRVYNTAIKNVSRRGMGTTFTFLIQQANTLHIAHVGDTRAYLIRKDCIQQLTKDHSWVEEQLAKGLITDEQAKDHEWRNLITKALGTRPQVIPDFDSRELRAGDIISLSSDGLHGVISEHDIRDYIAKATDLDEAVHALIALANQRGGPDNITLILMEVG